MIRKSIISLYKQWKFLWFVHKYYISNKTRIVLSMDIFLLDKSTTTDYEMKHVHDCSNSINSTENIRIVKYFY